MEYVSKDFFIFDTKDTESIENYVRNINLPWFKNQICSTDGNAIWIEEDSNRRNFITFTPNAEKIKITVAISGDITHSAEYDLKDVNGKLVAFKMMPAIRPNFDFPANNVLRLNVEVVEKDGSSFNYRIDKFERVPKSDAAFAKTKAYLKHLNNQREATGRPLLEYDEKEVETMVCEQVAKVAETFKLQQKEKPKAEEYKPDEQSQQHEEQPKQSDFGFVYDTLKYIVDATGIYITDIDDDGVPVKGDVICYSPLWVSRKLKNHDNGEIKLEITYLDSDGNEQKYEIMMGEVLQKKGVMELANHGVMVSEDSSRMLSEYINHLLYLNRNSIENQKEYETLGWKNDNSSFVLGTVEISKDKIEPINITNAPSSITNAISTGGTLKGWIEGTRPILKYGRARFKCYLSCGAPLMTIVEEKTKSVNDYGESSKGKTTTNELALSCWGNPEALNLSAITTKVGAEEVVKLFSNIPVNLDDIQAAEPDLFKQIVYMIGNESGKLRGKRGGGLRDVARWKTVVLTTGEKPIRDDKSFTGSKVRAIEIKGGLGADDAPAVKSFKDIRKVHYGHIAPILIQKILAKKAEIPEIYANTVKELSKLPIDISSGIADRLIKTFAVFAVGGMLFEEILKEQGEETKDPIAICADIMKLVIVEITDETYALRAIKHVYSWIDTKRNFFLIEGKAAHGPKSDIYGNFKDLFVIDLYVNPLKKELTSAGFSYDRVIGDWVELGFILKDDNKAQIKLRGHNGRGIRLDANKIYELTGMESPYFKPDAVADYVETHTEQEKLS